MTELSGAQRTWLRGRAHGLRPAVQMGREGMSEGLLAAIDSALEASELVKVQLSGDRDERRRVAAEMTRRLDAECVGQVGRMAILYRRQPDPERRTVVVPEG